MTEDYMSDKRFKLFIAETLIFVFVGVCVGVYAFESVWMGTFLGMLAVLLENTFFYIRLIEEELALLLKQIDFLMSVKQTDYLIGAMQNEK